MEFKYSDKIVKVGEFIQDPRGIVCVISDGVRCGIFWKSTALSVLKGGEFKNGFFLHGSAHQLSDEDAETMLKRFQE